MTAPAAGSGRYAPSPTGDLHVGNLRTAVVAWLYARRSERAFLLRWEDLDTARVRPGVAMRQYRDLAALGLTFDGEPLVQSRRRPLYDAALAQLAGHIFECFCTRREIAEAVVAPHGAAPRYPGTCRDLTEAQRAARRATRPPAVRLRGGDTVAIHDQLRGAVSGVVDDIVLRRNDGVPAYNLAVVVDDAACGVDQVVRGADLLDAALSQAHLTGLLGHRPPTYAHVPLVLNAAGQRLAKRDGAVTLTQLAAEGVSSQAVLDWIAVSLGLPAGRDLDGLLAAFDPARLPTAPAVWPPKVEP